jgi:hypothetical protein
MNKIFLCLMLSLAFESIFAQDYNFGHPKHIVLGQQFVDAIDKNDFATAKGLAVDNCNFQVAILAKNGAMNVFNFGQKEFFLFMERTPRDKYTESQRIFVETTYENVYSMKIPFIKFNKTDTLYCGSRIITMIRDKYEWKVLNFVETRELATCKYLWKENK